LRYTAKKMYTHFIQVLHRVKKEVNRSDIAVSSVLAAVLLLGSGQALSTDVQPNWSAIEKRAEDYRRLDPGVPVWPSTCDCIRVSFGLKDANGNRPVRYRFADAISYYGDGAGYSSQPKKSSMSTKGPVKELLEEWPD
jgi:hypothetical protein